jgi:hypothetical protein
MTGTVVRFFRQAKGNLKESDVISRQASINALLITSEWFNRVFPEQNLKLRVQVTLLFEVLINCLPNFLMTLIHSLRWEQEYSHQVARYLMQFLMQHILIQRIECEVALALLQTLWYEELIVVFPGIQTTESAMLIAILVYLNIWSKVCKVCKEMLEQSSEIKEDWGTRIPDWFLNLVHDQMPFRLCLSKILFAKLFKIAD